MKTKTLNVVCAAVVVALLGGGAASADEPDGAGGSPAATTYSCDALTSATVPAVKKRLTDQGIDVSNVTGPVGLSCRKEAGEGDGVAAAVTGVDGVAYRCASAQEKSRTKIVFSSTAISRRRPPGSAGRSRPHGPRRTRPSRAGRR